MKKSYTFTPQNVCSRKMALVIDDGVIVSLDVTGGCQGNLLGISKLIVGMKASDAIAKLSGIQCRGSRTSETSCPDQLSIALTKIASGEIKED